MIFFFMPFLELELGDVSGDGHNRSETFTLKYDECLDNLHDMIREVEDKYDLNSICAVHDINKIGRKQWNELVSYGFTFDDFGGDVWHPRKERGCVNFIMLEHLVNLWVWFINKDYPDLNFSVVDKSTCDRHGTFMGYGCF